MNLKEKLDYIYQNYRSNIIWTLLALHAIIISICSYNNCFTTYLVKSIACTKEMTDNILSYNMVNANEDIGTLLNIKA